MGNLIFNGMSSLDYNLIIQTTPPYVFPARDVETSHIAGRNGDYVVDNECYSNVDRTYSLVSLLHTKDEIIPNAEAITRWLTSTAGYARLEDSYDPDVYRKARYKGGGTFSNVYNQALMINAIFECTPQRYLKLGEKPLVFSSLDVNSSITIDNPTDQKSLPEITLSGLVKPETNEILMMTVADKDSKVSSSITLSDIPTSNISIDSDSQSVCTKDDLTLNLNSYIGLNGKNFPILKSGKNTITLKKYTKNSSYFQKYNDIIANQELMCLAQYQPFDALVTKNQKKFLFLSYDNLKNSKSEVYEASAYYVYLSEKASSYTFESFNTVLKNYSETCSFIGTDSVYPNWLSVTQVTGSDNKIHNVCKVASSLTAGGFFISNQDNKIKYHSADNVIIDALATTTITITYYVAIKNASGYPMLKTTYEDMPSWLSIRIDYDGNDLNNLEGRSPSTINFVANQNGYFWKDKNSIFGSASWNRHLQTDGFVLDSISWSTWKKAFISFSGLSQSTTQTFQYKFIENLIQYEDIVTTITGTDNTETTSTKKVHFSVSSTNDDLSNILYKALDAGYYRCNTSSESSWIWVDAGGVIPDADSKPSNSNTIYYLASIPTYVGSTDFPTWIDSTPIKSGGTGINPTKITGYKVLVSGYYRYSYTNSSGTIVYSDWVNVLAQGTFSLGEGVLSSDSYTIYYLETMPVVYDHNMAFNNLAKPPSWLSVIYDTDPATNVVYTKFKAGAAGYYKWDTNSAWVLMAKGDAIVTSDPTDDTTIYYMASLASYESYDLFSTKVISSSGGDPTSVEISAKVEGYYKSNNSSDWTYYSVGDVIVKSKITDSNTIYYLISSPTVLSTIKIIIIPRWWKL